MEENKIIFSHIYSKLKLNNCEVVQNATLIQSINVNIEDLSSEFINYDTDNGLFELPSNGEYLLLIFKCGDGHIFTTLRKFNGKTLLKYKLKIGQEFKIITLPQKES